MGIVYRARDLELDRVVALKFLPTELSRDKEANRRFRREAKAASSLDHPNVCTIHDIMETDDGKLFIVMAFYAGQTLEEELNYGPVEPDRALEISRQIAAGLGAAHDKGIIHRDIKPANVMITGDGLVKILDFGLAKLKGGLTLTRTGSTLGTAYYMSPEQIQSADVDLRTDIWSLGVLLYEMLTGKRPFTGEYDQAVSYAIVNTEPPLGAMRDQERSDLIAKCLSKAVSTRFQNTGELLGALDALDARKRSDTQRPTVPLTGYRQPQGRHVSLEWSNRPVAFALAAAVLIAVMVIGWLFSRPGQSSETVVQSAGLPRIAVLPFENLGQLADEFFASGITDEINSRLGTVAGLEVISRKSARRYDESDKSVSQIGRELNVEFILDGSVRWASDEPEHSRVRITPALIRAVDETQLWSRVYDRVIDDIFEIQSEIANAVSEQLGVTIAGGGGTPSGSTRTGNVDAYMLYLKGRYFLERRTKNNRQIALDYFEQAVELDPTYALAWAGIADSWIFLGWYSVLAPQEAFPRAKRASEKAIMFDEELAEAHISRAHIYFEFDHDWDAAEVEYKRGLALNPASATGHHWFSRYLTGMNRLEEARGHAETARNFDPLSLIINTWVPLRHYFAREYDTALEEYEKAMQLDTDFAPLQWHLGWTLEQTGRFDEAISAAQKAIDLSGGNLVYVASLGHAEAMAGNDSRAREILRRLATESTSRHVSAYHVAVIYGALGEVDTAFEWLDRAYDEQSPWIGFLRVDPRVDPLRSDPRFEALLDRADLGPLTSDL